MQPGDADRDRRGERAEDQRDAGSYLSSFLSAGKWIGNAEYKNDPGTFCPTDNSASINGIYFPNSNLTGPRQPCR